MAAPYNPPTKGQDFQIDVGLEDYNKPGVFKSAPTLAAGDVTVRKDSGAFANVATLPTATGKAVRLALSASEMDADVVTVLFSDQTDPPEWCDRMISIPTTTV